jgi:hypothetical protein
MIVFFFLIPITGIVLMCIPDSNKGRRTAFNVVQGINLAIFAFPLLAALLRTEGQEHVE